VNLELEGEKDQASKLLRQWRVVISQLKDCEKKRSSIRPPHTEDERIKREGRNGKG